ncbi:UDP-4-amino-4,6-dideoxy-N-acetyl-beta-L-altrosamine N-acetyltransferase [Lysinibacillus sp. KCTC 33748]|uniref:UDP-4-amino-4, 6-dideoxy-N-acetyl-beta-L-altrosamine N-acetyltransferase n=1 Tax=Lysinibacillus TaxID=400634 RepID=UPI0009A66DE2|nr:MULTISPECIES: UDP-4-amino-4,6-dideoxy-N-acetyl-beta-L-altrosamine N-acetyltransferase [unclassified Lysinibacillus]OXS77048.1 UDP-4-amino-4,6-dideoxy-N-acetyl-beta-L-altrosamine N-acetyltransferase [Lysinibacillus sp. KCTC 33748]SKB29185.1 UDP-4-amino-4,6-dideoxy-N-acetyl-beta-L-altrosamine N-acetyltransferase [Lysinibacillus sp. AC-3]
MIRFIKLREEHLEQVLEWRTQEDVTKFMNTDIEKDMDKQREWFRSISNSKTDAYWIIEIKEKPIGVISLNNIDFVNKRTSWGFYIGEEKYRLYGGIIPPYFYNYIFSKFEFHKITAEVMEGNNNVIKLNLMHGYRMVGVYKDHILKNGSYSDLNLLELLKEDWLKLNKYQKYVCEFGE